MADKSESEKLKWIGNVDTVIEDPHGLKSMVKDTLISENVLSELNVPQEEVTVDINEKSISGGATKNKTIEIVHGSGFLKGEETNEYGFYIEVPYDEREFYDFGTMRVYLDFEVIGEGKPEPKSEKQKLKEEHWLFGG